VSFLLNTAQPGPSIQINQHNFTFYSHLRLRIQQVGNKFFNRSFSVPLVACFFAFSFVLAFAVVHTLSSWRQTTENRSRLNEIIEQVISRIEYATDYSLLTAYDLANDSDLACDASGINAMQQLAHARSIIKDIQIYDADNVLLCQAFPRAGEGNVKKLAPGIAARNPSVSLHNIEFYNRQMLGVALKHAETSRVVIVSDFEALLYDSMPAALRDQSIIGLRIAGLSDFAKLGDERTVPAESVELQQSAQRFPLKASLKIDYSVLANWHKPSLMNCIFIALALAVVASLVFLREIQRPQSPTHRFQAAHEAGEFQPFFQPVVNAQTGIVEGCEALLRWIKADGTIIPPMKFIHELENTSMLTPVTLSLIERSLFVLSPILLARPRFHIAFNFTPEQIIASDLVSVLNEICTRHGVLPCSLTVELTERNGTAEDEAVRKATHTVREAGYRIALDDVGTGHNGLSQLHDFEADYLKIDKKFVDMLGQSASADAIVKLLVELARKIGLTLIAEGVETAGQAELLRKYGVHKLQGYLFSKPLPAADFITYCQINMMRTIAAEAKATTRQSDQGNVFQINHVA
jgi:c-di-GMP phosphodiesterase